MNMNMKNEKTMLALVLVAALAMVSVAGVALASESDAMIITPTKVVIEENETYDKNLSVESTSSVSIVTINGTYSGTISFYDVTVTSTATPFAVIVCENVSGVEFKNTYDASGNTVSVTGVQTGDVKVTKGSITLGTTDATYTGTLSILNGSIVSENTYGAIITLNAATASKDASVTVGSVSGGIVSGAIYSGATAGSFTGTYKGITNVMLGNDLTVSGYKASATASVSKIALSGTLNKIVTDTSSAAGTVFVDAKDANATAIADSVYGFIFNNAVYYVTVDSNDKITGVYDSIGASQTAVFDYSGLKVGSGATTGSVSGLTGTLYINVDASVASGTTVGTTATVINNKALTINNGVSVGGQFINNSTMAVKGTISAVENATNARLVNYGTFTFESTSPWGGVAMDGFYSIVEPSGAATKYVVTGYASLADAIAAAGTNYIYAGGYVFINSDATIGTDQRLYAGFDGITYVDGSTVLNVYGTFATIGSTNQIYIASGATVDASDASYVSGGTAFAKIDVDGTFTVKTTDISSSNYTSIEADTKDVSGSYTTYTNLYNALTKATSGNVTLLRNAALYKDATVASGVTLLNGTEEYSNYQLTIAKDVTLTVDGHIQIFNNNHFIYGTLVINDTATPSTSGSIGESNTGSFITGRGNIILTGTITVSAGAIFEIGCYVLPSASYGHNDKFTSYITKAAGTINVDGTLNVEYYSGYEGNIKNLKVLNVSSTGIVNNNNTVYVVTATVEGTINNNYMPSGNANVESYFEANVLDLSGTFNNVYISGSTELNGKLIIDTKFTLTGTLNAGTCTAVAVGVTVMKAAYFGTADSALDSKAITGTINFIAGAYAVVFGDFDASKIFVGGAVSNETVSSTQTPLTSKTTLYLGDDVYATEFANGSAKIVFLTPVVSGYNFVGWYDAPTDGSIVTVNTPGTDIGGIYAALYGKLEVKTTSVSLGYMQNGTWVVDGASCGSSATLDLTVGTHTIKFVADNGYELGDDYVIYVNGTAITGTSFTVGDNKITVTYGGEVKEKSTSGGLDLVTILLIIITIVIIIMAIIIALKLMRS